MKPLTQLLLFAGVLLQISDSFSQSVVNCTGATLKSQSYSVEYSIGEVAIVTLTGTTTVATQGLLQPGIKINAAPCDIINSTVSYFETPAKDVLRIVGLHDWIQSYQVYAADGKLVRHQNFQNNQINVAGLPAAGIYFVRLLPGCNGKFQVLKFMKR